ncbi:MAG: respiratory chain complex I subunit 1 family protein [Candidatus Bipolaricaulota bacterium]
MLAFKVTLLPMLIGASAMIVGLWYKGIDRKLAARMQSRVGPPIRQPFIDVKKLFLKENLVPNTSVPWLFHLAPFLGLVATVTTLLYLPIGDFEPVLAGYGDLILILYLLALPALAMVIGGFASGAPYAVVGAQREMVMMMSYELPLAATVVTLAWKLDKILGGGATVFSMGTIFANPLWSQVGPIGVIGLLVLLFVMLIVTPIELSKIPFDVAEAETEIAEGLLSEYSGRNLALFYLTDAVKTVAMASLIVGLFFPYQIGFVLGLTGTIGILVNTLFFLLKLFLVILFSVTMVRVAAARFKITQVAYLFWVPLTLTSLLGLGLIVLDSIV